MKRLKKENEVNSSMIEAFPALYTHASMWFQRIAEFRETEINLLYTRNPGLEVRAQHRQIIALLIKEGKEIIRRVYANGGLAKPANGFSLPDIQSAIEELENSQLQWNGGMPQKRKEEILKDVFGAA